MPLVLGKCANLGGDVEMVAVVKTLALRHPADTFVLVGRNSGETPTDVGLPDNVVNPWTTWAPVLRENLNAAGLNHPNLSVQEQFTCQRIFDELTLDAFTGLDALIVWDGQHGTTNTPIPKISDPNVLTKPHDWCAYYVAFITRAINIWRDVDPWNREEIHLNADARNRLKLRDLKWPLRHPVLTQYTFDHPLKHHRYGSYDAVSGPWLDTSAEEIDVDTWRSRVYNVYSRLEINGLLPGTPFGDLVSYDENWIERRSFGMFINEARAQVSESTKRKNVLRDWVLPLEPNWLHGSWSKDSLEELGIDIRPAPWEDYYPRLHSVRSTFTTPSSGSGWATAKPWEAFAAGTVCFFHPGYDDQDNILGDAPAKLRDFLRVDSPQTLARRVRGLDTRPESWYWVVRAQREHFERAVADLTYVKMIEDRLWK